VISIRDYEKLTATKTFFSELKKGTTIWIEATTVKGNNKIVLTDDSIKAERQ
jgi:hypothetical protein